MPHCGNRDNHRSGLTELDAVVTAARRGNFRAAAIELDMSPTSLSNAIAGLEQRLGVRLFNRTTRSVSLTEAGEQFVAQVAPALVDISRAIASAGALRDTPSGTLRINAAASMARQVFVPLVLEFLSRYPDMKVDIVTEGRLIDIVADGFDGGLRWADTVPRDMIAIPCGPAMRMAVVASPAYFAGRDLPQVPDDLLTHNCVRTRLASGALYRWEFERNGQEIAVDIQGSLTLDELELMIAAARNGAGIAHIPEWAVADDIASGRLVRVLEDWCPAFAELCFYYPSRRHTSAGLRAFIALIRELRRS